MTRRLASVAFVVTMVLVGTTNVATAKTFRECDTNETGRRCVVVTDTGQRTLRISVRWTVDEEDAPSADLPEPVKRSVWEANISCKRKKGSIDTLRVYGLDASEVLPSPKLKRSMLAGLTAWALPRAIESVCAGRIPPLDDGIQ